MMRLDLSSYLEDVFSLVADPKVSDLPLMGRFYPTLCICMCYFVAVKVFSKWMESRPPFEVRSVMVGYNIALVLLSSYMFMSLVFYGLQSGFTLSCWTVVRDTNHVSMALAFTMWLYYFSKIVEFLDTMFFIARKKFNLVSFLHVYHHMSLPALSWLAVTYGPGGLMTFTFILNSFVHIFMYSYYALAAAGPQYQKFLWWKKYLTMMQMIQFTIMISHSIHILTIDCEYPRLLVWLTLLNCAIFLTLFCNYFFAPMRSRKNEEKVE